MKDMESHEQAFEIQVNFDNAEQHIKVEPEETSDGAAYFKCSISGNAITQLREEPDGKWEQLWGSLDHTSVNAIGKAIKHNQTL